MFPRRFKHREQDCGFGTPCHIPLKRDGTDLAVTHEGYARVASLKTNGKRAYAGAHRIAFLAAGNTVSPDQDLDHLCRNRQCCNPAHLEAVSKAVNVRRGNCTKLSAEQVAEMRRRYTAGEKQKTIARDFGMSQGHTSHLLRGGYWSEGPCQHWEQRKKERALCATP